MAVKKVEENVLTQEMIDKFKVENPKGIYKITVIDDMYIVRTLGRTEYVEISNDPGTTLTEKEELITEACVLWPKMTLEDVKELPAGVPTTVAEQIMQRSGFEAVSVEKL